MREKKKKKKKEEEEEKITYLVIKIKQIKSIY